MSATMFLGRIVLPGIGLGLAGLLAWQAVRTGTLELSLPRSLAFLTDRADKPAPGPAPGLATVSGRAPDSPPLIVAEGRVVAYPGALVSLGAEVAGVITRVLVQEKTVVHKGDLLVQFRGDEIRALAEEAVARVAEIDAELARMDQELARVKRLPNMLPDTIQAREAVEAELTTARARRAAATAAYKRIQAEFARTRVRAPIDGVVIAREVNPGEMVIQGTPLIKIVDLNRLRIEAEIDEFDIPRLAKGSPATITAEGYSGRSWRGTVEEIADTVLPRRTRPEDPGRFSDTRVLPVRIAFQEPTPLKLGQRAEVEIAEARQLARADDRSTGAPTAVHETPVAPKAQ
jgi:HlyD family secretion protein